VPGIDSLDVGGEGVPLDGALCKRCGSTDFRVVMKLIARPLGSFSLSGQTMKFSAYQWPFAVCQGCGYESEGEIEEPDSNVEP
jgi:hypothetical protein